MYSAYGLSEIERMVDDPETDPEIYALTQPGGVFHQQVAIELLEAEGRTQEAAVAKRELGETVEAKRPGRFVNG